MKKQIAFMILALFMLVCTSCSSGGNATQVSSNTPGSQVAPTTQGATLPVNTQAPEATNTALAEAPAATTAPSTSVAVKIGSALNLVIGTKDRASVYSSYNLVSNLVTPTLSDDQTSVVTKTIKITADVQGPNVHLFYTASGSDQAKEGYIIGEKEYRMTAGKPEEMIGQISLSWAGWHLGATFPFSAGASLSTKTGTDTIEGRPVDVYTVDSATIDPAQMEAYRTLGMFPIDSIKGTLWIDQQTGGAVKAVIDYEMDVVDPNTDKTIGVGKGHLDLSITQVGKVTVQMP